MKLFWNLVCNDIRKNRVISIVLLLFMILSALLMAGGLRVMGTMISATSGLNEAAMPPDYLKLHKGEYDAAAVQAFADAHDYIKADLVVAMLNIDNANLVYQGETLEKCLMDNGFVVQNEGFDYLLDMDNKIAAVGQGEVGVPVYYHEELGIQVGDTIVIRDGSYQKDLTVVTLIRDAQMNAPLTSSKRFLICSEDQKEISTYTGKWEYSFEYLLQPDTDVTTLERDYIDADMPANGVAITGNLLNMLNSLSYGLIAFLLLAVSLLLMIIALLCLSYIIRATMLEENRTIGAMKAMGFVAKAIVKIYLLKYMLLAVIAGLVGYFAAVPFGDICSASVLLYCGTGIEKWMQWIYPIVGILLLELLVILQCRKMIRKNQKSTVVELLRGENGENRRQEGHFHLPKRGLRCRNLTMAFGELSCKWKEYAVLFLVFALSAFLILLPLNMQNTTQNPSFITYMGIGKCDIRVDIQNVGIGDAKEQKAQILDYLEQDQQIERYALYQNGYVQVENDHNTEDNQWEYLRVSGGDETIFPLEYMSGCAPQEEGHEIALSYMEAEELQKKVGDTLRVKQEEAITKYTVCGIYQDVTYGGKTAKAQIAFENEDIDGYVIYLNVADGVSIEEKAAALREVLKEGRVTPVTEFIEQTLGGVTGHMKTLIGASVVLSLLLIILISTMFLQLITTREHSAIAIKKSIGFSNCDIRIQFGVRVLFIQIAGIITGTILANTLGEAMFGALLSSMGVAKITMLIEPVASYIICPLIQIFVCGITVIAATGVVKKYHIRDQIME